MTYTFATVIIPAESQAAAQADLSEYQFTVPLSADGNAPATHWMSSGAWSNEQLELICNTAAWPRKVYFGQDWAGAVAAEGLTQVVESPDA